MHWSPINWCKVTSFTVPYFLAEIGYLILQSILPSSPGLDSPSFTLSSTLSEMGFLKARVFTRSQLAILKSFSSITAWHTKCYLHLALPTSAALPTAILLYQSFALSLPTPLVASTLYMCLHAFSWAVFSLPMALLLSWLTYLYFFQTYLVLDFNLTSTENRAHLASTIKFLLVKLLFLIFFIVEL